MGPTEKGPPCQVMARPGSEGDISDRWVHQIGRSRGDLLGAGFSVRKVHQMMRMKTTWEVSNFVIQDSVSWRASFSCRMFHAMTAAGNLRRIAASLVSGGLEEYVFRIRGTRDSSTAFDPRWLLKDGANNHSCRCFGITSRDIVSSSFQGSTKPPYPRNRPFQIGRHRPIHYGLCCLQCSIHVG